MDMEIKNRIEAFLSWKTSGVKPTGWDLEPQNKQEMWIAEEAKRLDSIEFGGDSGEKLRKSPTKAASTNDYNELENIPILPIGESLIEGEYYYQAGNNIESIISTSEILSKVKFDRTADWNNYLSNLDFQEDSILPIAMGGFEEGICAFDYSKASLMVDSGYAIIYFNPEPEVGEQIEFIYSTVEVSDPRIAPVSVGFQSTVDENGYYNIPSESLIPSIVDSTINGTLIKGVYSSNDIIGKAVNNQLVPIAIADDEPVAKHLVQHNIKLGHQIYVNNTEGYIVICNDNTTPFDFTSLKTFLDNYATSEGYYPDNTYYPASGLYDGNRIYGVLTIKSKNQIRIQCGNWMDDPVSESDLIITDNVVEIL